MIETEEEAGNRDNAYSYAMRVYTAFVFTIAGVFLGLLLVELAKEGDPTLEIGLGVAVLGAVALGALCIKED